MDLEAKFTPNVLNSSVYIMAMALQVATFAVNYRVCLSPCGTGIACSGKTVHGELVGEQANALRFALLGRRRRHDGSRAVRRTDDEV